MQNLRYAEPLLDAAPTQSYQKMGNDEPEPICVCCPNSVFGLPSKAFAKLVYLCIMTFFIFLAMCINELSTADCHDAPDCTYGWKQLDCDIIGTVGYDGNSSDLKQAGQTYLAFCLLSFFLLCYMIFDVLNGVYEILFLPCGWYCQYIHIFILWICNTISWGAWVNQADDNICSDSKNGGSIAILVMVWMGIIFYALMIAFANRLFGSESELSTFSTSNPEQNYAPPPAQVQNPHY